MATDKNKTKHKSIGLYCALKVAVPGSSSNKTKTLKNVRMEKVRKMTVNKGTLCFR